MGVLSPFYYSPFAKLLFGNDIDNRLVASLSVMAYPCFLQNILFDKFQNGHFPATGDNFILQVFQYLLFLFTEGEAISFTLGQSVRWPQFPAVDKLLFSGCVNVFERIAPVFMLAFAIAEDTIFVVASFLAHSYGPFPYGKGLSMAY